MYKVLIVEDDPMVAMINEQYVKKNSLFTVVDKVKNGKDALNYLELHKLSITPDIVNEDELRKVSSLDTPQQVLAVLEQPKHEINPEQAIANGLCLALDDVQNPGNLGTIVRIADWFGIKDIFCSKNTADIYNPKTVQATMGGLARVRIHYVNLPELLATLPHSTPIYGTFLNAPSIYNTQLSSNGIIVMGNEGRGVSEEVEKLTNQRITIPNYPAGSPTTESLNVAIATAIVCAEFRRQQ